MNTRYLRSIVILLAITALSVPALVAAQAPATPAAPAAGERVRQCDLTTAPWFEPDPAKLGALIGYYLRDADKKKSPGRVVGVVAPHAGYPYAGQGMGLSYSQIKPGDYRRVIIIGPSHTAAFRGMYIPDVDVFETPLGKTALDRIVCDELLKSPLFMKAPASDALEHSVQNQLPFLQYALGSGFRIVPLVLGDLRQVDYDMLATLLRPFVDKDTLIVISSDFTHDNLEKAEMYARDKEATDFIVEKNFTGFSGYIQQKEPTICGRNGILLLLKLLPSNAKGELLKYYTSGDVSGRYGGTRVVGYASIVFSAEEEGQLTDAEKRALLKLARYSLEMHFAKDAKPERPVVELTDNLKLKSGYFVTFTNKGELRGCIGSFYNEALPPINRAVMDGVEATLRDFRFAANPVTVSEAPEIEIEISVLSAPTPIASPEEIIPGKHGVYLIKGNYQATFLPQVATQEGWSREQMLAQLAVKAGLRPEAWKDADVKYLIYTAQVFSEGQFTEKKAEDAEKTTIESVAK